MKLLLSRQYLEDICRYFMPYMLSVLESRSRGCDPEKNLDAVVCLSVLEDLDIMFQRKTLTRQQKFTITLKKAEAVILMKLMISFPVMENEFWRMNLRNNIVEQLHKQLV